MVYRTVIEWVQERKLDPVEKEKIEARVEFEKTYDPYDDLNEKVDKEAIIHTDEDKMYVQIEDDKICMLNLLNVEYIYMDDSIKKFQERIMFKGNLNDIEKKLTNKN